MWTLDSSLKDQDQEIYQMWDHSLPILSKGSSGIILCIDQTSLELLWSLSIGGKE
jgi:hypothetical protein